ncbi:E2 ubiquitin-conjugating enzyme [Saitozyma sp. JCM 24511]|nr:E2 ubiquitin-conjugating enzyme [Saitozyma sp. JCM 24511]
MSYGRKPTGGAANGMAAKRIKKEIADLAKENLGAITLTPNESNIFQWKATLPGPAGSPYEGGVFEVDIRIPEDYPFSPPHLQFVTKLYHCNVASTGAICLDLLKTAWSPALSLYKVILSLSSLLTDPNPADPLVPAIAQEYKRNRQKHDETARQWTRQYALPKTPATAIAAPAAPAPEPPRTFVPRPRPISRPGSSSVVPTQLAGTRRRHAHTNGGSGGGSSSRPIDLASDSESERELGNSSDIEVLGESSRNGAISGTSSSRARDPRGSKRARIGGANDGTDGVGGAGGGSGAGGNSDDVIVIDE